MAADLAGSFCIYGRGYSVRGRRGEEFRTGVGCRRRWTDEEKGRTVTEAVAPGSVVSEVARGYELQHLFTCIRAASMETLHCSPGTHRLLCRSFTLLPNNPNSLLIRQRPIR